MAVAFGVISAVILIVPLLALPWVYRRYLHGHEDRAKMRGITSFGLVYFVGSLLYLLFGSVLLMTGAMVLGHALG